MLLHPPGPLPPRGRGGGVIETQNKMVFRILLYKLGKENIQTHFFGTFHFLKIIVYSFRVEWKVWGMPGEGGVTTRNIWGRLSAFVKR